MKSNTKSKIITFMILGIIFFLSPNINSNLIFNAGYNKTSLDYSDDINLDNENLKISKVSGKIHINNNWSAANAVGICTGNGTYSEPYVIKDLVLKGEDSGGYILIENSIVYFRIENCSISEADFPKAAIEFLNVTNGQLINNNCSLSYYGIKLSYSENNTISGNSANYNSEGIQLYRCNINKVSENTVNHNNLNGIVIKGQDNIISDNVANFNGFFGIGLDSFSNYNTVSRNIANKNQIGIYIWMDCDNNNISENTANSNNDGILLYRNCENNIISGNKMDDCGFKLYGVFEDFASNIMDKTNLVNEKPFYLYINEGNLSPNNFTNAGQVILLNCNNSIISGLNVSHSSFGISLYDCNGNNITGIISNYNSWGIFLARSHNNTISRNTANNNDDICIYLASSDNNVVLGNTINNNSNGITLDSTSNSNKIFLNNFTNNENDALDDGINNRWDNGTVGNYWDDYSGKDANDDGIGDTPYYIPGSASSQDNYPIFWDAPVFSVNSPSQNDYFSINPPNFDISIEEGVVNSTWYTLDGGIVNKTFTGLTGTIGQTIWDSISEGDVTIRFYVNDSAGNIAFEEVTINKDTTAPIITINSPSTDEIFGNNAPGYNLMIIESNIHTMWYTLDSGTTNFTFTGLTGTISQTIWDSISEGDVTIRFYVNDSVGNITFEEIEVIKRIPEVTGIPGYNLFFILGILSVVAIVVSTKLKKFNK